MTKVVDAFKKLHAERAARSGAPGASIAKSAGAPVSIPAAPPKSAPAQPPAVSAAMPRPVALPVPPQVRNPQPSAPSAPSAPTAPIARAAAPVPAPAANTKAVASPPRAVVPEAMRPVPPSAVGKLPPSAAAAARVAAAQAETPRPVPVAKLVSATVQGQSRPLVAIDEQALLAVGLVPPPSQQRRMSAEYRQIKRPLLARMQGRHATRVSNGHLIMVSSALPGEGKTFTSINLALSMALEKDLSVMLIDADVTKPHVSSLFGIDRQPGLLDLLQDPSKSLRDVVLPTSVPRLSLMSAGRKNEDATELLASAGMDRLVEAIGKQYPDTVVLFDASPLLLTIEPRVLAQVVGQIVLVVRAGVTSYAEVTDAIAAVGQKQNIGLVLNQCEKASAHGYYYGYAAAEAGSDSAPGSPVAPPTD